MKKTLCLAVVVWLFPALWAQAGEAMPGPPKILQMVREEVKPGRSAAHDKISAAWQPALAKAKWPVHYLGMNSITGPSEALFLVGRDSFADIEKDNAGLAKAPGLRAELERLMQQDAEVVAESRTVIAFYRADLSYRAASANVAKMRYMQFFTFRVRPGHETEFAEAAKIVRGAYEKANVDIPWAIYQGFYGAPSGTFYILVPIKSLGDIDAAIGVAPALAKAEGEEGQKRLEEISRAAYVATETNIYAFNPKTSYVSPEFAAADPEFWTPRATKPARAEAPTPAGTKTPAAERRFPEQPAKK